MHSLFRIRRAMAPFRFTQAQAWLMSARLGRLPRANWCCMDPAFRRETACLPSQRVIHRLKMHHACQIFALDTKNRASSPMAPATQWRSKNWQQKLIRATNCHVSPLQRTNCTSRNKQLKRSRIHRYRLVPGRIVAGPSGRQGAFTQPSRCKD